MLKRIGWIQWFFTVILTLLFCRLAYVQLAEGNHSGRELAAKAAQRWAADFSTEQYARGDILDRFGQSLTDSKVVSRIILDPWLLQDQGEALAQLRPKLTDPDPVALDKFWQAVDRCLSHKQREKNSAACSEPVVLYGLGQTQLIRQVELAAIPGAVVLPVKVRYGENALARHLVGYLRSADALGVAGLEAEYESWLRGSQPEYLVPGIKDVVGRPLPGWMDGNLQRQLDPQRSHVLTTLDKSLQGDLESVLDGYLNKGAALVLAVDSGQVLAMASRPNFDQNCLEDFLKGDALLNRCLRPSFYPGSVFKVVTAAAALEAGLVQPMDQFNCGGGYRFNEQIQINCLRPHGILNLQQAFGVSCNAYFINLAQKMGPEALGAMSRRLGLSCDLNQSSNPILTGNTAIGQQGVKVSPLQMARVYSMIARGGMDIEPQLLLGVLNQQGQPQVSQQSAKPVRLLDRAVAFELGRCLRYGAEYGTARSGWIDGKSVAGKTGTAQANTQGRVIAWYCGFLPADEPEYAIAVMVEENKEGRQKGLQGGQEAAAIFKAIGEKLLS